MSNNNKRPVVLGIGGGNGSKQSSKPSAQQRFQNRLGLKRKTTITYTTDETVWIIMSFDPVEAMNATAKKAPPPLAEERKIPPRKAVRVELPRSAYRLTMYTKNIDGSKTYHTRDAFVRGHQDWNIYRWELAHNSFISFGRKIPGLGAK